MQTANISGVVQVEDAGPSSPNGSTSSEPNMPPSSVKDKRQKLELANLGRLLQDNHRLLKLTADSNQFHREQVQKLQQAQVRKAIQDLGITPEPGAIVASQNTSKADDMGDIKIDSPEIHHHYTTPPAPAAVPPVPPSPGVPDVPGGGLSGKAKAAIAAALLASGIGSGIALWPKTPAIVPVPSAVQKWQAIYERLQPDGTWKVEKTEPLKTP